MNLIKWRIFHFKDMEIFNVQEQNRFGPSKGYLAVIDFHRPTTLDDYPWLKNVETQATFKSSSNLIKAIYLTDRTPTSDTIDEIVELAESCMIQLLNRDWDLSLDTIIDTKLRLDELRPFCILDKFIEILNANYDCKLEIPDLSNHAFNHLSHGIF